MPSMSANGRACRGKRARRARAPAALMAVVVAGSRLRATVLAAALVTGWAPRAACDARGHPLPASLGGHRIQVEGMGENPLPASLGGHRIQVELHSGFRRAAPSKPLQRNCDPTKASKDTEPRGERKCHADVWISMHILCAGAEQPCCFHA